MIVDTHVHVLSDDVAGYPRPGQGPAEQSKWPAFTGEMLLADMDANGVDMALVVQAYHTYKFDNSYAIDVALKYPGRMQSVVVIDQSLPDAPALLQDMVENKGVRGVRLMKVRKSIYGDPQTFPLWEKMRELKVGVCFNKIDTPDLAELRIVLERFPQVPVALDHSWAGALDELTAPYTHFQPLMDMARYPNLYLKIAPNITHDLINTEGDVEGFWTMVLKHFGANRVMWGSNYPAHWNGYGKVKERLALMREQLSFLGAQDRDWIFGGSALRVWPA